MEDELHKRQVGDRLRLAREAIGYEQRAFARLYEIDHTKLNHWEKGRHYPAPAFIRRLWERHRISADWIYLGEVAGLRHDLVVNLLGAAKVAPAEKPEEDLKGGGTVG